VANAIEADGLSRRFGAIEALSDLHLRVPARSIFGYLGPNGAGKTTTLHLLLGIVEPTAGTARVAGFDVRREPTQVRRRCGALLEFNGLYERLSARENLELQARMHGLSRQERDGRIRELLEQIGLWDRRDDALGTWSRGMKQRLAIVRTLLHRPEVVFLDEPTAGFDPQAAVALRDELRQLARSEGMTVFLTTHNLHEAEAVCDQVAVVRKGRLLAVGRPGSLLGDAAPVLEVHGGPFPAKLLAALRRRKDVAAAELRDKVLRLELTPEATAAPIVEALVAGGVGIEELRRVRSTLEDDFLALVGST
jgi:ABC-2 type transport system ATP-binding protein